MSNRKDYAELRNDEKFINCVENFDNSLNNIESSLLTAVAFKDYEELSTEEKVKLDNYLAYSINSLYWMYIKLNGQDPNEVGYVNLNIQYFLCYFLVFFSIKHGIKNELSRVRQTILRDKQIYERNTIRPVVDKAAAGRFIKHGLHIRFDKDGKQVNQNNSQPIEIE